MADQWLIEHQRALAILEARVERARLRWWATLERNNGRRKAQGSKQGQT
jgi:hypothetical protein